MNMYFHELKSYIKSFLIWSGGMFFLIIAGLGKYYAGASSDSGMNELMKQMPKSLQNLFGVGIFDLNKVIEYFGVMFLYILIMVASHAVMLGSGVISKEERDRTIEFLLVKPVSRFSVIKWKLLAATTICFAFTVTTFLSAVLSFSLYSKELYVPQLLALCGCMFIIQIAFMAVGSYFASLLGNHKKSSAAALSVMMGMFFLSILVDIFEQVEWLRFFTFFQYADAKDILKLGWSPVYPIISIIITGILIIFTFRQYQRRDLRLG
jgi:ABC-2 type transport system permease protein